MLSNEHLLQSFPKHRDYVSEQKRFDSFKEWPYALKQDPNQMAESGFFYTKTSDWVICFFCNVGVRCWEESDDPHEQHALHSPGCEYLKILKGEDFIHTVGKTLKKTEEKPYIYNKKPSKLCTLCNDNECNVVFLNCGHLYTCIICAIMSPNCGICRKNISKLTRVYLL